MKQTRTAALLRWLAPVLALLLLALRVATLKLALDENGLLSRGSNVLHLTALACACVFACLWLLCLRLNRLPGREDNFTRHPVWTVFGLTAAVLVLLGSLMTLLGAGELPGFERAVALCGLVSGLLLGATALCRERGPATFWLRLVPALYTTGAMILHFRDWSHDPLVIHILPLVLAWSCCTVEMILLSGFSLKAGHRRSAVLFGLAVGLFACMSLPDYVLGLRQELPELLQLLGLALWCAADACVLTRDCVQSEQPPEEPEPPAETAPEETPPSAPEK